MNELHESVRPVPRWLHIWAIATVLVTLVLLVLGQFVTSFRAGMADPVWPTEPWYLANNYKLDLGYLIEHTHRIAGFAVGGFVSILALGLWFTEPRALARWTGLLLLVVLLGAFGQFHRELIAQRDPAVAVRLPNGPLAVMGISLLGVLALLTGGWNRRGSGLRLLGIVALIAVMIQGLLGGFRVRLDALFGPELAPIHGIFAQIVFCLLVSLAALTRPTSTLEIADDLRHHLSRLSVGLTVVLFVQLIWGAMVRHAPNALNQRLHLLTAFLAVVMAVRLIRAILHYARPNLGFATKLLAGLLSVQVVLGVEAWMGKFGEEARSGKSASAFLAEAEPVTAKQATLRSAHTLIGTGILATAAVLTLRVSKPRGNL